MQETSILNSVTNFKGIYLSGFFITNLATITALSLLFENVHLPNQLEILLNFAKKNKLSLERKASGIKINISTKDEPQIDNVLEGLSPEQQHTAKLYLMQSHLFISRNHELFPKIFTTDIVEEVKPFTLEPIGKGEDGKSTIYEFTVKSKIVADGTNEIVPKLNRGYVPIVGKENVVSKNVLKDNKAVASILAMKSIEMLMPSFIETKPEVILEARERLKDQLPPFWTSMLKLSTDAKKITSESKTTIEAINECQNIVDTLVRPALVDLVLKIEKEKKNWFYKIVSPLANTVKLFVGNPSLNPVALIKGSLAMATDMTADYMTTKQKIEDLKDESGLTYLLEVHKHLGRKGSS